MGVLEDEMERLLDKVDLDALTKARKLPWQDRQFALGKLVKQYFQAKYQEERTAHSLSCVGEKVWIHLPGDDRMVEYEGTVISLTADGDEGLIAVLKDPRYGEVRFDPRVTYPHYPGRSK